MARKLERQLNTLLGVCILRASAPIAEQRGLDLSAKRGQKLKALRLVASATPKASRVATFVVLWALALDDHQGDDELTLTEWREWASESERTAWRKLAEFRELFPEFDTPKPLALQILEHLRRQDVSVAAALQLPVTV